MRNAETYKEQVFKILDREKTEVRYNSEWLDKLGYEGMIGWRRRRRCRRCWSARSFISGSRRSSRSACMSCCIRWRRGTTR
jgi:tyrosyl-tRNA synthetase